MNRTAALALALVLLPATYLPAQELTLIRADGSLPVVSSMEGIDAEVIRDQLSAAHEIRFQMEADIDRLGLEIAQAKAAVEVKKSEIDIIETQKDLADDEDRDAEKEALERDKDFEEANKKVLERTVEVLERERDHARARREEAEAAATVNERQLRWLEAHDAMAGTTTSRSVAESLRMERDVLSGQRALLEALRDRAGKSQDTAERERQVYEAQIRVMDAERERAEVER